MAVAENSPIEWTDHTWTPVVGCDAISPACANCYAALMAARLEAMGQEKYRGLATRVGNIGKWTGLVKFWEPELVKPLTVRKAARWFLTSMGDVGHDKLTDDQVAELFGVMAVAGATGRFHREEDGYTVSGGWTSTSGEWIPAKWANMRSGPHTFMVLTKRAERLASLLLDRRFRKLVSDAAYRWAHNRTSAGGVADGIYPPWSDFKGEASGYWPMPNVFIGCTAENQERADELRPHMATIAAAGWKTFVSFEPALGLVDWSGWEFLQQLISGGETGYKARPSHPDWHRTARDWCADTGVPYLFKQHGDWVSVSMIPGPGQHHTFPDGATVRRVGKKAAGRLLDGREHNGFPSGTP